jgi:type IV pilus assembly protein PilE
MTLLELLVVLAIIGIITSIAYPSYQHFIAKAHRTDGQIALQRLAIQMEQYATENRGYSDATLATLNTPQQSAHGFYQLKIISATTNTFEIAAIPQGAQAHNDIGCATLTLNQLGQKSATGKVNPKECW